MAIRKRKRPDRPARALNMPLTDLGLSVRSCNRLRKIGIQTLSDLARRSEQELRTLVGEISLVEIRDVLTSNGLELGRSSSTASPRSRCT